MARIKRSVHSKKKRRKVLERASGYKGARSRRFRTANEQVMHAMQDAYRDRRARKGDFRRLWIARINAAARQHGTSYSRFIAGLKAADVEVDRKMLAEMAVSDPVAFGTLVDVAASALPDQPAVKSSSTEKAPKKPSTSKPQAPTEDKDEAAVRVRERFVAMTDAEPDDLKEIKGVGPVLESTLHDLNIKTFAQIAAFDDEDVEMVTAAISGFKDRVARDDWVGQATELHAKHHGE